MSWFLAVPNNGWIIPSIGSPHEIPTEWTDHSAGLHGARPLRIYTCTIRSRGCHLSWAEHAYMNFYNLIHYVMIYIYIYIYLYAIVWVMEYYDTIYIYIYTYISHTHTFIIYIYIYVYQRQRWLWSGQESRPRQKRPSISPRKYAPHLRDDDPQQRWHTILDEAVNCHSLLFL